MSDRLPSTDRQTQVVACALDLLATTPVDQLTTRQIAERAGISQPALFRHFRSREQLLEAVVAWARGALEEVASAAASAPDPWLGLEAFAKGLFAAVDARPGLLRLLFHHSAHEAGAYQAGLAHLLDLQRSLASELVRQAKERGAAPATVGPRAAGRLFVALVHGVLLQGGARGDGPGTRRPAPPDPVPLVAFFRAAVGAGQPAEEEEEAAPPPAAGPLARLDVRPLLAQGTDPLGTVLTTVAALPPDGALELVAPFRPTPLLRLLGGRGYRVSARERADGAWDVEALGPAAPEVVDLRDLAAPEPLERVLLATAELAPGSAYLARVPRYPRLLLPRLAERGLLWAVQEAHDGSALLHVRRP